MRSYCTDQAMKSEARGKFSTGLKHDPNGTWEQCGGWMREGETGTQ